MNILSFKQNFLVLNRIAWIVSLQIIMGDFKVHQVRFFDFVPGSVNCMAYGKAVGKLALSR